MKPVEFKGQNVVIAKDQPQYLPLPAHVRNSPNGETTSCWALSWIERVKVTLTGRIYLTTLTFRGPLQPIMGDAMAPAWLPLDVPRFVRWADKKGWLGDLVVRVWALWRHGFWIKKGRS